MTSNSEILAQRRCFLLDMDGTFYIGDRLIDGALKFIDLLERQEKHYYFLTNNSSKSREQYVEKISRLGLNVPAEKIFTSGEATAIYITQQHSGKRIFLCGTPALEEVFCQRGFELVAENPEIIVLGFDTTLTYKKLWRMCDYARLGLPYIATHPDINCPVDGGFMPDIGAMIAFIGESTGRQPDVVIGKPNKVIIDMMVHKTGLQSEEMVIVGDRLYTDIALGKTTGITTVLVLSGETRFEDIRVSRYQPDYVFQNINELYEWLVTHSG